MKRTLTQLKPKPNPAGGAFRGRSATFRVTGSPTRGQFAELTSAGRAGAPWWPTEADPPAPLGFSYLYFGPFQANEIINIKVRAEENTMFPFFRINEELFLAAVMACDLQTF